MCLEGWSLDFEYDMDPCESQVVHIRTCVDNVGSNLCKNVFVEVSVQLCMFVTGFRKLKDLISMHYRSIKEGHTKYVVVKASILHVFVD